MLRICIKMRANLRIGREIIDRSGDKRVVLKLKEGLVSELKTKIDEEFAKMAGCN